mmetsp:Transcript_7504/g.18775  ORF Transcript_7504/g.18775 Transcript_7504/m.18775 type:complete len:110 (-) Transcript_7504:1590-1919(-)
MNPSLIDAANNWPMNLKYFRTLVNWGWNFDRGRGKTPKVLAVAARGVGITTCPDESMSGIQSGNLTGLLASFNGIEVKSAFNPSPKAHVVLKCTPATVSHDINASAISA